MNEPVQTYANHRRLPPPLYALALLVLAADAIVRVVVLAQAPSLATGWAVVVAIALLLIGIYARRSAQVVQDRVIRLEMRRRLERVLPPERHGDIPRLSVPQLVGLRFASDAELSALVQDAVAQSLSNGDIKRKITTWQADWLRV